MTTQQQPNSDPSSEPPEASSPPPVKLVVLGKGGAGKTVLVALLARAFADRGRMVLAADLDVNPGLALSLGIPADDTPLPMEAVEERAGAPYGWTLAGHLTPAEAVRRYGAPAGPRIFYLGFGNIGRAVHPLRHYFTAVRHVADNFDEPGWAVIVDAGAGPTGPFEGYARSADLALVVAEPIPASVLTAVRILGILREDGTPAEVVAVKVAGSKTDVWSQWDVAPFCDIPFDPDVRRLERAGSLARLTPNSPALAAARELASKIELRFSTPERDGPASAAPSGELAE